MTARRSTPFKGDFEQRPVRKVKLQDDKCKEAMNMFRNLLPAGSNVKMDPFDTVDRSKSFREFVRQACDFTKPKQQSKALRAVATWLAEVYDTNMNKAIAKSLIPTYVKMLGMHQNGEMQYQAALSLTFLARSYPERSNLVVRGGAIQLLVQLLVSNDDRVAQACVRTLANILFYGVRLPDLKLVEHFSDPLVAFLKTEIPVKNLVYVMHVLTIMTNPTPAVRLPTKLVADLIPHLKVLLKHPNLKVLVAAVWIVANLTQPKSGRKDMVIESKVMCGVVPLLQHKATEVREPALLSCTYIAMGNVKLKQKVVGSGALTSFHAQFPNARYTALYCLLHISAGTQAHADAVVEAGLLPHIVEALRTGTKYIKMFATGTISQLAASDDSKRVFTMMDAGVVEPFCKLLGSDDADVVMDILAGLLSMLHVAEHRCWELVQRMQKCGAWQLIRELKDTKNAEMQKVLCQLEVIFSTRDDLEALANFDGTLPFQTKK